MITALLLTLCLSRTEFVARSGYFGPQGEVRSHRPFFDWQIRTNSARVPQVFMTIDGRQVRAGYDGAKGAVIYSPETPLESGLRIIHVACTFANSYTFTKDWSVTISAAKDIPYSPSADQMKAIGRINEIRRNLGVEPVTINLNLSNAASAHASYLRSNAEGGHREIPGSRGFIGKDPASRRELFGFGGPGGEGVSIGMDSTVEAVDRLFDAPYHRLPFMQPGQVWVGVGGDKTNFVIEFSEGPGAGWSCSPANRQENVPTSWIPNENPNPFRFHSEWIHAARIGYPIVIEQLGAGSGSLKIEKAELRSRSGTLEPTILNTPGNDPNLTNAAVLFPTIPLVADSWYSVRFAGTDRKNQVFDRTLSFKTGT